MKKSHFLIAGATIITAVSIATYLYLRNVAAKVSNPLNSAQIVPESAIMASFIHPNQQALNKLQQFGTPETRKLISQSYAEFQQENLAEANIDWEKDIQPWLGGIMFAFVPAESGEDTDPVNILMLVGIKNKLEVWKFANKLKGDEENQVIEKEYQGVTIREVTDESGKTFNLAILGDYLAIATVAAAVEDTIDTFQGQASLAMQENAAESLQQSAGVENALATIFIPNYSQLMTAFTDDLPENEQLSTASLVQLEKINSVVMGIGVDDAGLRLRTVTKLNSPLPPEQTETASGEVLQRFPAETMMSVSGKNISLAWSQFVAQAQGSEDLQDLLEMVRKTFQDLDLDVDREVFGWMDGEFAIGLIGSNEGRLVQTGVGGAMILETSDRFAANGMLRKLNRVAMEKPGVSLKEKQVGEISVTEWQMVGIGSFLGYGWLDDDFLFVALGEPLIEVMITMPDRGLIGSDDFEEVVGSLPTSNQGYFYWNMEQMMVWANRYQFVNLMMPRDVKVVLSSIRGIGVTASWSDELTNEMEILWVLQKK
ncbi:MULTISPECIES: DUF3352 domain-containing protein [Okeania]|uniref:DUF3352 domain-containing protein n=1 Tax=Okeania hirsuta TaxID=1458930 RepID=A0A3N6NX12_9CYAN|nr:MULTISPECIES: DUF3352 domain-containing protein [Okeania]NES76560.1 DUF3352 domain-containing protein [Okeania sp. SIO1H4]NES90968.1 DUF3352 domain-containing protein [Okeania sp. SIO2B9]NET20249.1 DUF3352 domain-containing protein [Okeania sp. SIO1H5]NET78395.1 DUF3352 domain-containing protein [Okeania sp. SIO1F9]NET95371.1 DUF3352 domain-containing protein [Okeania sp. SIO1H2]